MAKSEETFAISELLGFHEFLDNPQTILDVHCKSSKVCHQYRLPHVAAGIARSLWIEDVDSSSLLALGVRFKFEA